MFRCYSYTIVRERINLCLLKLQFLKQSVKIHRCAVNTVVVWLLLLLSDSSCNTETCWSYFNVKSCDYFYSRNIRVITKN